MSTHLPTGALVADTTAEILANPDPRRMAAVLPGVLACAFMFHLVPVPDPVKCPGTIQVWDCPLSGRCVDRLMLGSAEKCAAASPEHRLRRFRMKNLTVCLAHSVLSGTCALRLILSDTSMLYSVMTYYSDGLYSLVQLSAGYFVHDAIDMASFSLNRHTVELLLHHLVSLIAFGCALSTKRMLVYATVSLLMEVNSVFLHLRSLSSVSGWPAADSFYCRVVRGCNVATFVACRMLVQAWMVAWFYRYADRLHWIYSAICGYGNVVFAIVNVALFWRVLKSDGWIGRARTVHSGAPLANETDVRKTTA